MNPAWLRYLSQIAPWLTLVLVIIMFIFLHGTLSPAPATGFSLPDPGSADSAKPGMVALLLPGDMGGGQTEGTLVFFDDARYLLSDPASVDEFAGRLSDRSVETRCDTLTLMADRRVPVGDVMQVMAVARSRRIAHVQLAEKND